MSGDRTDARTVRQGRCRTRSRFTIALLLFVFCTPLLAKNGAFRSTLHGNRDRGPDRRPEQERGSCTQCHGGHRSHKKDGSRPGSSGLFASNDNQLCFTCHSVPSALAIFPSSGEWILSSHASSPRVVAPGRPSSDANKCVNCHDPHGVKDGDAVVPSMLAERETRLCLSCHNGSQGADIAGQMLRGTAHGERALGTHDALEGNDPKRFSATPAKNRHVGCSDCHNPHLAAEDRYPVEAPVASRLLFGVSRIQVLNGPAGSAPALEWLPADDPEPPREYEICFKCHSAWTNQPAGQADFARLTNPENSSFHPIQAVGRNPNIDPAAFANGMSSESIITCSACHTGDDPRVKGPHGSSYPYLLSAPTAATTMQQPMQRENVCFGCHAFDVYADGAAEDSTQRASRFNSPAGDGHAYHVGTLQVTCYTCHETHGSASQPALIATAGRSPGIRNFDQTSTGGECSSSCHAPRTYTINYPR